MVQGPKRVAVRQEMIDCLVSVVTAKFGPMDPATRAAIERVTEPARLREMFERAVRCTCLDELIAGL